MSGPVDVLDGLVDRVAEAIRDGEGLRIGELPWDRLCDDKKRAWRGDAERALAVVKGSLTADPIFSELLDALRILVTANLPDDDPDFTPPPESPMGIAISTIYRATGSDSVEDVRASASETILDALRWRFVRDADPDAGHPYIVQKHCYLDSGGAVRAVDEAIAALARVQGGAA